MVIKKRTSKTIDLIFIAYILGATIFGIVKSINSGSIKIDMDSNGILNVCISLIFIFILQLFITILKNYFLIGVYIAVKLTIRSHMSDKTSNKNLNKDMVYYRDIIKQHSPATLSYAKSFRLDKKDVVATLMGLELKQKIKITDKVNILTEDIEDLEENEKYIFNSIKNKDTQNIDIRIFENKASEDCKRAALIEETVDAQKNINVKVMLIMVIYTAFIFTLIYIQELTGGANTMSIWLQILLAILNTVLTALVSMAPMIIFIQYNTFIELAKKDPYIRSDSGQKLAQKLEGLKKYLGDFGSLEDNEKDSLVLWEDYLIYSVIFEQNTNIVDEYLNNILS
ncbi:MAG: DUF2207 domain-containing protein [Clostridia bacterium]